MNFKETFQLLLCVSASLLLDIDSLVITAGHRLRRTAKFSNLACCLIHRIRYSTCKAEILFSELSRSPHGQKDH